jgi:hypothetical protein
MLGASGAALLAGGAAVLGLAPGATPASPDAALIALCEEVKQVQAEIDALWDGGTKPIVDDDERNAAQAPFWEARDQLLYKISQTFATTADGHRARARCYIAVAGEGYFKDYLLDFGYEGYLLMSLIRDLAGVVS